MTQQPAARDFEADIPLSQFKEHVTRCLRQSQQGKMGQSFTGFDEEFNYIENASANDRLFGDYSSALLPSNRLKHRYANVLPTESTRVRLQVIPGQDGSDFINANYINGLVPGSTNAYIATQGPLEGTLPDFWRMVWETKCCVVVMLTKEVEQGRTKCDKYWPEPETLTFGNFKLTLSDQEECEQEELIERKFTLFNTAENTSRPISHLQYTAWPDMGLPKTTHSFLSLVEDAFKFNHSAGPIVVHCSAGIGRSGVFCIVHSIIEKIQHDLKESREEPKLNVVKAVLAARKQRSGMVQTEAQYTFVNLALLAKLKDLTDGNKDISDNNNRPL